MGWQQQFVSFSPILGNFLSAWSAASSPRVCLRVCLYVASCWKSAGILLLELFLRVDTQSQVCLQATTYLALSTTCGFVCVSLGLAMCLSVASWWKSTWAKIPALSKSDQFCISSACTRAQYSHRCVLRQVLWSTVNLSPLSKRLVNSHLRQSTPTVAYLEILLPSKKNCQLLPLQTWTILINANLCSLPHIVHFTHCLLQIFLVPLGKWQCLCFSLDTLKRLTIPH